MTVSNDIRVKVRVVQSLAVNDCVTDTLTLVYLNLSKPIK